MKGIGFLMLLFPLACIPTFAEAQVPSIATAQATGNLKTTPEQQVETQTSSGGQQVVLIQPANPEVVYVPQYNPQTGTATRRHVPFLIPNYAQTVVTKMYDTRGKCSKGGFNESPITGLAYGGRPDLLV